MTILKILIFAIQLFWMMRVINYLKNKQILSKMKRFFNSIYQWFYKAYWINCSQKKQTAHIWKRLKQWFVKEEIRFGIYEREQLLSMRMDLLDNTVVDFQYIVNEQGLLCSSYVFESYDDRDTTNLFILATHFNSLLRTGKVVINPEAQTVRYTFQCNLAALIANPYMMRSVIMEHYDVTKDVCWAIEKLVTEHEEPSIIIADLLRMKEQL